MENIECAVAGTSIRIASSIVLGTYSQIPIRSIAFEVTVLPYLHTEHYTMQIRLVPRRSKDLGNKEMRESGRRH